MRKKVLFITPAIHAGRSSGGLHVSLERLASLARIADVTVLALEADDEAKNRYPQIRWVTAGALRPRSTLNLFHSYLAGLPLSVWRNTAQAFMEEAKKLSSQKFDLAYIDHWLVGEAGLVSAAKHKVLHLHNAEPEIFERAALNASLPMRLVLRREAKRCAVYLAKLLKHVNELHLLSEDDQRNLAARNIRHSNTHVFLPGVSHEPSVMASFSERELSALFVGTLSWHANQEGLHWYAQSVLPHMPNTVRFDVVGGGADKALEDELRTHRNVNMHGYVPDIESFYSKARCLVAPLLSGSGIKIKILHALARGLPVITTTTGIEGFPRGYEKAVLVVNDPRQFSEYVKTMLENEASWTVASTAAQEYCKKHFSSAEWESWVNLRCQSVKPNIC